jgi:UDP-glucose 4-epimerase
MAKVLVTGGAGFIGSHIVDALLAARHEVVVLDDLSSGSKNNVPPSVPLQVLDISTPAAAAFVREFAPDVVVHAAAQMSVRRSMDEPTFDAQVNVVGLVTILSELREKPGRKVVFLSTGGAIYGEQSAFPATEDHPANPESVYGLSKKVGEEYLGFWSRVWGLKVSVLRLANVYGPRQNPHGEAGVVAIFCRGLLNGKALTINGSGEQTRDFVFVGDVARAAEACVSNDRLGVFNIGTGRETSVNQLVAALTGAVGEKGNISNGEAKGGEQQRSCIDPSRAKATLGWQPQVALEEGVRRTVDWFRENV